MQTRTTEKVFSFPLKKYTTTTLRKTLAEKAVHSFHIGSNTTIIGNVDCIWCPGIRVSQLLLVAIFCNSYICRKVLDQTVIASDKALATNVTYV